MNTRLLRKGDKVLVDGSYNRAVSRTQLNVREVEVDYTYPAEANPNRYAATVVVFTDGYSREYRTSSVWILA